MFAALAGAIFFLTISAGQVPTPDLTGYFDVDLEWTPDQSWQPPPDVADVVVERDATSIFTALGEQLGVRLENARGPVDVVVIDSVQRPTPD